MKGELFIALAEGGNERRIVHRLGSGTVVCWALPSQASALVSRDAGAYARASARAHTHTHRHARKHTQSPPPPPPTHTHTHTQTRRTQ